METTTIRVSVATRDRLTGTRETDFVDESLGGVIDRLLDEHASHQLSARLRRDAEHARSNSADLAEVRAVQAELDELSAW